MPPASVARWLLNRRTYEAWQLSRAIDREDFPSRQEFKRLRQLGGVQREAFAVLADVTFDAVRAFEKGRVQEPAGLRRSASARRLVAALQHLDAHNGTALEVSA